MKLDDEMRAAIASTLQISHYYPTPTVIGNVFMAGEGAFLTRAEVEL